ncbi:DUF2332 domain-containing protein [Modestobacter versicolor]|uniref:DUF2332 domain-containing protein n=1 Tax=Modestobacter versicolor TaxID=429133 RepID=UPI0034DE5B0C
MAPTRTLADVYRTAGSSPLEQQVAAAVGGSAGALRAIGSMPARCRRPAVVLAALHDLALSGRAPALAAACSAADGHAAAAAAVDTLVRQADEVAAVAGRRRPQALDAVRCAVLYPAVAEAAHRTGATSVGLVDVGSAAGLDTQLDRVGTRYDAATVLGDPRSPVQLSASVVGGVPVPARAVPEVVARTSVGPDPVDVTDPDDVRWLRACVPPDRPERTAALDAAIALVAGAPPRLVRGDVLDRLADAVRGVPAGALPVVTTTWALSRLPVARRPGFLRLLAEAAADRTVAWVSVEGVGVAPSVPTLGDRPASGHSIVGLTVADRSGTRAEVLGRCWSRGRTLSWLVRAEPPTTVSLPGTTARTDAPGYPR